MTLKNKLLRIRILLFQPDDKYVKAKNTENRDTYYVLLFVQERT